MKQYQSPYVLPILFKPEDVIASSGVFFEEYEDTPTHGDRVDFGELSGFFSQY